MTVWIADPPDNRSLKIEILPTDFDANGFCVKCGGALSLEYICERCGADHWPGIKRNRKQKRAKKNGG